MNMQLRILFFVILLIIVFAMQALAMPATNSMQKNFKQDLSDQQLIELAIQTIMPQHFSSVSNNSSSIVDCVPMVKDILGLACYSYEWKIDSFFTVRAMLKQEITATNNRIVSSPRFSLLFTGTLFPLHQ